MTPISQMFAKRRWLMAFLVLVLALASIVVFERALAEPPTLKPPFKVNSDGARPFGLNGPEALPLNGAIIFSQTFNSSYVPTDNLNVKGWHEVVGSTATNQYTWGWVSGAPLTNTVWAGKRYAYPAPPLDPATDTYTNGMDSWLIYGPFSLSEYHQVVLTATYWLDTKPGDFLGLAYSTNGSTWTEPYYSGGTDPDLAEPQIAIANLNALSGRPVVWVALVFTSNNDDLNGRGAFLQDVVVRGTPYARLYLPLTRRDATPTPTPTPTATPAPSYRYFYTFTDESASNNPDFNRWGGDRSTGCTTANCTYYQGLARGLGNPGNAFTLWITGNNGKGGAGPRQSGSSLATATNFEYSADVYVYQGQPGAIYGLVFDASPSTFPDSGTPPFAPDYNYYTLELRMDTGSGTTVAQWQFVKITNGVRQGVTNLTALPVSLSQRQWHNLKVRQSGATLQFYFNGVLAGTAAYDTNWGNDRRRFGLYIDVRGTNNNLTPFEFFADNIAVKDQ